MSGVTTHSATNCPAADPNPVPPTFVVPHGACDCHLHVFGPQSQLVKDRVYTPPDAGIEDYQYLMRVLGLTRAVVVQPSIYGTDNLATLTAVAKGGREFRAIVVVDEDGSLSQLRDLQAKGAVGARVNALFQSDARVDDLHRLTHTLAEANWHLQMLADVSKFSDLEGFVRRLPVPVVFDHMGHLPTQRGVVDPGFQSLLRLVGEGSAWVKLSGSYRITEKTHPPYTDVAPFAEALIRANPDHLVWASDWPHPHIPTPMPNDGHLLEMLTNWAPDETIRAKILVDNPARLYGFDPAAKEE